MSGSIGLLTFAVAFGAAATAHAAPVEKQTLTLTNAGTRTAECALVVDGKTRTYLKIRPGKTWFDAFDPRRELLLVCEHATKNVFGPLRAGETYRLVDGGGRVDVAEGTGE